MAKYKKTVLPNGIRIVTEQHPSSRAVSCGLWICTGTRDEDSKVNGIAHFTEHLVFKGTKKRSAFELARCLEAVGGDLNAYTTREYICFHTTSLKEDLAMSLDVLTDLASNAEFPARDFDREREVVLQEIAMTVDNPEEWVFDEYFEKVFGKNPLGWPILGSVKSVSDTKRSDVLSFYKNAFSPQNMIVSVAGNLEHDAVVEKVSQTLGKLRRPTPRKRRVRPKIQPLREFVAREYEQNHILVGFEVTSFKDARRFEAFILNALLGGGMTSKLYQSIREKRGLAYSVYSQLTTFMDTGLCIVYAGTDARNSKQVLDVLMNEMRKVQKNPIKKSDLQLFKTQVRGGILLGADDIENRMNSLGVNEMVFEDYRSVDHVIFELDSVGVDSMNDFMEQYFDMKNLAIFVAGAEGSLNAQYLSQI